MLTDISLEEARQVMERARAGQHTEASTINSLVGATGGYSASPWVWLLETSREEVEELLREAQIEQARQLLQGCRNGDYFCNLENLSGAHEYSQVKAWLWPLIGTNAEEMQKFWQAYDRQRAVHALAECRKVRQCHPNGWPDTNRQPRWRRWQCPEATTLHRMIARGVAPEELGTTEAEVIQYQADRRRSGWNGK